MGRKIKVSDVAASVAIEIAQMTPELMRTVWEVIAQNVVEKYKLGDNEIRMVMDDALTRAGIMWDVKYNVKKLGKMDLSYFTDEIFRKFVKAFHRAVNVLVEMKTGYAIGPLLTPNRAQRRVEEAVTPKRTGTPRLRRSYSKRLRVKK